MFHVKLTRLGNAVGVALPSDAMAKLGVKEGDSLILRETATGYQLDRPTDAELRALQAFEATCTENAETLRALAR